MDDIVTLRTNGTHTCLCAHIAHISTIKVFAHFGNSLKINLSILLNVLAVNFNDVQSTGLIWQGDFNLPVQSSWSKKSWVKNIGSIGSHDAFNPTQVLETVKLIEKFHQGSLDLTISRTAIVHTLSTNGVNLVKEDDTRLVVLGISEHLTDHSSTLSNVLINDR